MFQKMGMHHRDKMKLGLIYVLATAWLIFSGGLMFEIFSMQIIGGTLQIKRFFFFGGIYSLTWILLHLTFRKKRVSSYIYSAFTPYVSLVLSIVGLWLIGWAFEFFWLLMPAAFISELGRNVILHARKYNE